MEELSTNETGKLILFGAFIRHFSEYALLLYTPIFYLTTFPDYSTKFNFANLFFSFTPILGGLLGGYLSD